MSRLYLDHFGLHVGPFDLTPNPDFFFSGGQRGELLEAIAFAALDTPGIVLVIGEVGNGKTMLCRMLAQRIQQLGHDVIYLDNPSFGPREILHTIAHDWGLKLDTNQPLQWQIQQHLLARHRQARRVVLIIDEAQAMPAASLEEIRLLSNLESATDKLLRIVLFGQPELDDKLRDPALRQLRDRIVHRFDIAPLSVSEAQRYLYHRLQCVSNCGQSILSEQAALRIAKASRGRLRSLHHLGERALLAAYAQGSATVEPDHVHKAVQDLERTGIDIQIDRKPRTRLGAILQRPALVLGSALTGAAIAWLTYTASSPTAKESVAHTGRAASADPATPTPQPTAPDPPQNPPVQTALEEGTSASTVPPPVPAPTPDQSRSAVSAGTALPPSWHEWLQRGQRMLEDTQQNGYTIQLLMGLNADAIARRLAADPKLSEHAWILPRLYPPDTPQPVWALFWGHAHSRDAMVARLRELPPEWQRQGPQIRSLAGLRAEPQPGATKATTGPSDRP